MWGESKEDMQQRWSCNQMEQCLKALGHGGIPKVPLHIIDCGGSCSLDTTLRTGVWESLHNLFSPAGSRESHILIYNWTQHIDQSLNMSVSAAETTSEMFFPEHEWYSPPFSSSMPSHLYLNDLPSIRKGRNNLLWCGGRFLHSDRGNAAHSGARDCRRGSVLHSCHHTQVKESKSQTHNLCSPAGLWINKERSDTKEKAAEN